MMCGSPRYSSGSSRTARRRDAIRRGVGERCEQHAVDEREDGGVGADAERERDNDGQADDRRTRDRSNGVPDVLAQFVEPAERLLITEAFAQLIDAAEGAAGGAPRFIRRQSHCFKAMRQQSQVITYFLVCPVRVRRAGKRGTQPRPETTKGNEHGVTPGV
jgi:hypothetical protein